jgi:hypothetical protein
MLALDLRYALRRTRPNAQRIPLQVTTENRLTDFPPCPTSEEDFFPPTGVGSFPPASRDKACEQDNASLEEQEQDQPQEPQPLAIAPQSPVHPAAQPVEVPARPTLPHKWPPERTVESVCLRPGCGVTLDEWKYLREECQGEAEDAAHA